MSWICSRQLREREQTALCQLEDVVTPVMMVLNIRTSLISDLLNLSEYFRESFVKKKLLLPRVSAVARRLSELIIFHTVHHI